MSDGERRDVHHLTAGQLADESLTWLQARGYRAHVAADRPALLLFARLNEPVRMAQLGDVLVYEGGEVNVE